MLAEEIFLLSYDRTRIPFEEEKTLSPRVKDAIWIFVILVFICLLAII